MIVINLQLRRINYVHSPTTHGKSFEASDIISEHQ